MADKLKLEQMLEIFLITFNRCARLDNALAQLLKSPFARVRITVLDNCSPDDTPFVVAKYRDKFPDFHSVRHNRNIGGDNNYLRAVELSNAAYTWVVCDDDDFDFSAAGEVIEALESDAFDLLYVASRSPHQLNWQGYGATSAKKLIRGGARYYYGCTFWPALIFRTRLFDTYCFINAPYLFPPLEFINKSINEDFPVYVARQEIVVRFDANIPEVSPLYLYKEWVANAAKIKDVGLRYTIIEQFTKQGFLKSLFFWIALEKAKKRELFFKRLVDIFFGLTPWQRCKFFLLVPVMIIPVREKWLLKFREMVYRILANKRADELPTTQIDDFSSR